MGFYKWFEKQVLLFRERLKKENENSFNLLNRQLDLYKGFLPRNKIEKTAWVLGLIVLIFGSVIFSLFIIFTIFPPLFEYIDLINLPAKEIFFILELLWLLITLISLMVFFMGISLVFYANMLIYLFNFGKISFLYALKFSWFYLNSVLYEFAKHVLNLKFLIFLISLIVSVIVVVLIVNILLKLVGLI